MLPSRLSGCRRYEPHSCSAQSGPNVATDGALPSSSMSLLSATPADSVTVAEPDGRELGPKELARPDWPVGSVIYRDGPQPNLRVAP